MKYLIVVLGFISLALINPLGSTNNDHAQQINTHTSQIVDKGDPIAWNPDIGQLPEIAQPELANQSTIELATVVTPVAPATIPGCGDNTYANEVYMFESGCSLTAVNPSSGDCGIGQAGPCSKLVNACPDWQSDYACQNNFFNNYALSRYGSWYSAYEFHLANGWW